MFEIKSDRVVLTDDCQYGPAGTDLGHVADVMVNHLPEIDPDNLTGCLAYKVARACCDAHKAEVAALERQHEAEAASELAAATEAHRAEIAGKDAELAAKDAEIQRLLAPQPEDVEAIEAAAKRRAQELQTQGKIEERAKAILEEE